MQIEIHTAEPVVPEPIALEVQIAITKLKKYKSPGTDQIPVELVLMMCEPLHLEIHKLVNSIWNKEELPEKWKESVIMPIYRNGNETDCSNHQDILMLLTSYKILSNILLSRLSQYVDTIIENHQCGF
jgi:hypothetical protein